MTSKLTRLTDDELTETLRQATSGYPLPASVEGNLRHAFAELQERRKAEKDSEPVAWTDEEELRDVNVAGIGYLFGIDREANKFADPRRQIMLYRHAQPAPVVPEEKPMPNPLSMYVVDAVAAIAEAKGWNACRAAMLQAGNSPVIPDGSADMLRRWLAFGRGMQNAGSQLPHNLIAETESMLAAADCSIPMISDRWIPVSERVPEEGGRYWCYVEEQNSLGKSHYQWNCSWNGDVWSDNALTGRVTHWMPLPAAPQEVKSES
ncbi:DUF551 domain-containing protein [Raoultella ornithinolytica]|uniref:DUF551 domain-containing protein n=1 Tax=Raoultella ornithinolytica TaxID=54291 RepID=UPI0010BE456D|nr:DUF551 domain-containing protein [Raoultella ornithinolytica]QCK79121.1 DUF551 domain-containing protein [Raoultella ornithinolytica]